MRHNRTLNVIMIAKEVSSEKLVFWHIFQAVSLKETYKEGPLKLCEET